MSACVQCGPVVDAVAGHRHDVTACAAAPGRSAACPRARRARPRRRRGRAARRAPARPSGRSCLRRTRSRRGRAARPRAAIARAVAGWSPVTIATRIPALPARCDRVRRARPRRVLERRAGRAARGRPRRRRRSRRGRRRADGARCNRQHPQAAARPSPRPRRAAPRYVAHERARVRRALHEDCSPTTTDMRRRRGSNGNRATTGASLVGVDVDAEPPRERVERGLHRIAVRDPASVVAAPPGPWSSARAAPASARSAGSGVRRRPRRRRSARSRCPVDRARCPPASRPRRPPSRCA